MLENVLRKQWLRGEKKYVIDVRGHNRVGHVEEPREATGNSNRHRLQPEYAEGGRNTVADERTHPFEG